MTTPSQNYPSPIKSPSSALVRISISLQASILVVAIGGMACVGDDSAVRDAPDQAVYVRVNQVGYLDNDTKVAIAFSHQPVEGQFAVVDHVTGNTVFQQEITPSTSKGWGTFAYYYILDFSDGEDTGTLLPACRNDGRQVA